MSKYFDILGVRDLTLEEIISNIEKVKGRRCWQVEIGVVDME